jgi:hypothetical protein
VASQRRPLQRASEGWIPAVPRLKVQHDRGLALVYGAALGGWTYLIVHAALLVMKRHTRLFSLIPLAAAVVIGALVRTEIIRHDDQQKKPKRPETSAETSEPG